MDIKKLKLIIILSSCIIFQNCNKHCSTITAQKATFLSGGYTLYNPLKDSIQTGDTLFIGITVPEKLTDNITNTQVDFSNASNMISDVSFSCLKGLQSQVGALDSFTLVKGVGSFSVNSRLPNYSVGITFIEQNGNYSYALGCIPQKKGIYVIDVSDIPYATKKCDNATISIISKSSDSHLHYLKDIYYGGGPIDAIDSTHSYCFKVY